MLALALISAPLFWSFAAKPPMGWNSWDCFATTVTEAQVREQADVMDAKLKKFGWSYVVVDIQWYEPNAKNFDYRAGAALEMDSFGRLLPAVNRFPSSAKGAGFKSLADYVHRKGLKFGLHLLRGIPRQAVVSASRIFGSHSSAKDIADEASICPWNTDMFGVDMDKPDAQSYYDSVFVQIAGWGVDFVKVDDISRPYHKSEIEAIRKAIDKTGRRIVLSLSPGETPLESGYHVMQNANMWRISDDFWDSWPDLVAQFERCHKWEKFVSKGHFPDADMLPIGKVRFGERSHFTQDEAKTMLTLWSISRSPLMLGCDLTKLDDETLALIANPEVLDVNQNSWGGTQTGRHGDLVSWEGKMAKGDSVMAIFNLGENPQPRRLSVGSTSRIRDLWNHTDLHPTGEYLEVVLLPHAPLFLRLSHNKGSWTSH